MLEGVLEPSPPGRGLGEGAGGARAGAGTASARRPHPNPLPWGEGTVPVVGSGTNHLHSACISRTADELSGGAGFNPARVRTNFAPSPAVPEKPCPERAG